MDAVADPAPAFSYPVPSSIPSISSMPMPPELGGGAVTMCSPGTCRRAAAVPCPVCLQVFERDQAAVLLHIFSEQPRGLAFVEILRAQLLDSLKSARQLRLHQPLAGFVKFAVAQEKRASIPETTKARSSTAAPVPGRRKVQTPSRPVPPRDGPAPPTASCPTSWTRIRARAPSPAHPRRDIRRCCPRSPFPRRPGTCCALPRRARARENRGKSCVRPPGGCSMKPPPPIFPAEGCVTASANPTATAASTALPPDRAPRARLVCVPLPRDHHAVARAHRLRGRIGVRPDQQ